MQILAITAVFKRARKIRDAMTRVQRQSYLQAPAERRHGLVYRRHGQWHGSDSHWYR